MSNTNTGGPAFPFEYHNQTSRHQPGFFGTDGLAPGASQQFAGMTLRDYAAFKAMQVIYSTNCEWEPTGTPADEETIKLFDEVATDAYLMADAMLRAREA